MRLTKYLLAFTCVGLLIAAPAEGQQFLETLEEVCLGNQGIFCAADNQAQQGIATTGINANSSFITSRGTCQLFLKDTRLYRFIPTDIPKEWAQTGTTIVDFATSHCHIGDIATDGSFIYAPMSNFFPLLGADDFHIVRFHLATLLYDEHWDVTWLEDLPDLNIGDLAGVERHADLLYVVEHQSGTTNAHIFTFDVTSDFKSLESMHEIETKHANGIAYSSGFLFVSWGPAGETTGTIDVYTVPLSAGVNHADFQYHYDASGEFFKTGDHAEGLTFRGKELWVCVAAGDEVRRVETPSILIPGKCCFADGACAEIIESECEEGGGIFQGIHTICPPDFCPEPTGACCIEDDRCLIVSEDDCTGLSGDYLGHGTVCVSGLCDGVLHVPSSEYPTIQSAINAASSGDQILVARGKHSEHGINFLGKDVTVRGVDRDETIIDAGGRGTAVLFVNEEDSGARLEELTITGGFGEFGGGVLIGPSASPRLLRCTFRENEATTSGGAVFIDDNAHPLIFDCGFRMNTADFGGAVFSDAAFPTLDACRFEENEAIGNSGGAVNNLGGEPRYDGCDFVANSAPSGGAILNQAGTEAVIVDCEISENTAEFGGGMYNLSCNPRISDTRFEENTATHGGGMYNYESDDVVIDDCVFGNNEALSNGGAIRNQKSDVQLLSSTVVNNTATFGAGIRNAESSPAIRGCTLRNNVAAIAGGGINNESPSNPPIEDTVLCQNLPSNVSGDFTDTGGNCIAESCADINRSGTPDQCEGFSCGNSVREPPENCTICPEDVQCSAGMDCIDGKCVPDVCPGT